MTTTKSIPIQSCLITVSSLPNDPHTISEVDNDFIEVVVLANPTDTTERPASLTNIHAPELLALKVSDDNHTPDRLASLPPEIVHHIIYMTVVPDFSHRILLELMRVSKHFRKLATSDAFWYPLFENKFPTKLPYPYFRPQIFTTWRECYAYEYQRARGDQPVLAHQQLSQDLTTFTLLIGSISPVVLFGFAHTYWIYPITKYFLEALETPIYLVSIASLGYQRWICEEPDRIPSWKGFWKYIWATFFFRVILVLQIVMLFIATLASIQVIHSETIIEVVSDILFSFPLLFWIVLTYTIFSRCRSTRSRQ